MQKIFKVFFFELFSWRGRKQLESPADLYRQLAEYFLLNFPTKETNSIFCRGKNLSPESFLWKWESSFDKGAEIFLTKSRDTFVQGPKKFWIITLKKKLPKNSLGPAVFVFHKAFEIFLTRFRKKIVCCPNILEKCIFWKTFFSLKCSNGHVKCSFNKSAKKLDKRPKTSAQCLKMIKNFICFPKDFLNKISIDTENAVLKDRPNFPRWITANDSKKTNKRCKNFSKFFSSKCSIGEVESSLKALLTFYRQLAEIFLLDFPTKVTNCKFAEKKNFHPKVSFENGNPVLTKAPRFSSQVPGTLSF